MSRVTLAAVVSILAGCAPDSAYEPRNGDIVFQTSRSSQSLAIQLATKSPYSHMGIVYFRDGEPLVFEAVQPVKLTPLPVWIERGERGHFVAKRLRDADSRLTPETLQRMLAAGEALSGKDYDAVEAKVKQRYGDRIPLDEVVVSPVAIFDAADLVTVYEN